ncbi:MAG: FAD-binding protein [Fimbriimonas sp.]
MKRLLIEVVATPEGRWHASIPDLPGAEIDGATEKHALHSVIGQALTLLEDPEGSTFVYGDQEWRVQGDRSPKREFVRPTSTEEVVEAVREWSRLRIVGRDTRGAWSVWMGDVSHAPEPLPRLELRRLKGIVQHDVEDQVVVVRAGTSLAELNAELAVKGQCIPLGLWPVDAGDGSVGGAIALNLPHVLEGQTGTWRDWVVGLTVVNAAGEIVKCGSKAVKNVAGYDVQKLLIGARGTLGVVTEVVLRTFPIKAMPSPRLVTKGELVTFPLLVHRVLRTDFEAALAQYADAVGEPATGTLWANFPMEREPQRFAGDWVLRSACGLRNLPLADPTQIRLMRRAKDLFDPTHKLNPGEMGIF